MPTGPVSSSGEYGEWDILLKIRAGSVEEIGGLVVDRLRTIKGIEKTKTCVVFQMIKESVETSLRAHARTPKISLESQS